MTRYHRPIQRIIRQRRSGLAFVDKESCAGREGCAEYREWLWEAMEEGSKSLDVDRRDSGGLVEGVE